ncbi:ThuA domain-containing protein [Pelagicoccus mobilis]|uniref:ThuA domain-containing protein n=1 Tax=Pelagicoccus mobilis TaxID=415221 RepID=A0A934VQ98_9BACT|nr:ThuA domain-containing protein [Pelagicoccus mobilis]MBK1878122.1 ThuA domain-containing protein [Pelagicoccus mobilis]
MTPKKFASFLLLALCFAATNGVAQQFKALLYTKTNGWHHDSVNAGVTAMEKLSKLHDFSLTWTEHTDRFFHDESLKNFDVVIFLLTTGDVLNDEQQAAFERYIQNGGGYVGIHSAADTEYDWDWYTEMVGHMFHIHPAVQTAVLKVEDPNFPGMDRFAPKFIFTDEWYEFDAPRSDELIYLMSVDEKTYNPEANWGEKRGHGMGDFHPVSWYRNYDGGRAFYTALGHLPSTYSDTDFMHHVYGGIYWAATGNSFTAGE